MGDISVRDVSEENIEDVFKVCSHSKLDDPLQRMGMELRRHWISDMIKEYGTCVKIAYLDEKPVAQIMFYLEKAAKFLPNPRMGAVLLRCVYNPFVEARGLGASTALVNNLIDECKGDPTYLRGIPCSFIASEPFNTGEGTPMAKFYISNGFRRRGDELIYEVKGKYKPYVRPEWNPAYASRETATVIYDSTCEWSYVHAINVRDALKTMYPDLAILLIDQWQKPEVSLSLANRRLVVKGKLIEDSIRDKDAFEKEVRVAVEGYP